MMPTITPLYCNPFFRICKQNFRIFENFFRGKGQKSKKAENLPPKQAENRPEKPSQGHLPADSSHGQPQGVGKAQVAQADAEAQIQPAEEGTGKKKQIGTGCPPGPQGPQKIVDPSQRTPDETCPEEALGIQRRGRHLSRRLSQPPDCRGSS